MYHVSNPVKPCPKLYHIGATAPTFLIATFSVAGFQLLQEHIKKVFQIGAKAIAFILIVAIQI